MCKITILTCIIIIKIKQQSNLKLIHTIFFLSFDKKTCWRKNDDTVICQFCFRIYFGDKRLHAS